MITGIKGRIIEKNPAYVVIETAGGLDYLVNISLATYTKIREMDEVRLFTHYVIKEDEQQLFGFFDEEERSFFRLLITVNGIGVNTARLILSSMSVHELHNAIITENAKVLQAIKGIGGKTAQRLIIELKDKIGKMALSASPETEKKQFSNNNNTNAALSALVSLGFPKNSAESVLEKIIKSDGLDLSIEDLIKKALKLL
ncbi:MAG: Holliday junction branch migration protein RuvA [Bacteroidales bacterium]|jgi:Holliday junction DNA helicase RuvA|nr:Holliday junction branch migration protein RuvA [Bacteroidales bacterium]